MDACIAQGHECKFEAMSQNGGGDADVVQLRMAQEWGGAGMKTVYHLDLRVGDVWLVRVDETQRVPIFDVDVKTKALTTFLTEDISFAQRKGKSQAKNRIFMRSLGHTVVAGVHSEWVSRFSFVAVHSTILFERRTAWPRDSFAK